MQPTKKTVVYPYKQHAHFWIATTIIFFLTSCVLAYVALRSSKPAVCLDEVKYSDQGGIMCEIGRWK